MQQSGHRHEGGRMRRGMHRAAVLGLALIALGTSCTRSGQQNQPGQNGTPGPTGEHITKGGVLRIGTMNEIDSLNPFNWIESQTFQLFIMVFPQFVQYDHDASGYKIVGDWATSWDTSADGKDWTFHLVPGTKWSDGTPMTADDAVWTINTTVKYANGPTAVAAPALAHVTGAEAPDASTVIIHYEQPVGNVLEQLEQFFIVPR